ncbi:MAG: Isoquinoline 1-oxidoreductase subunit, partial [Methyloceanibacter sp.]
MPTKPGNEISVALGAAAIIVFGGVIVCVAQPGTDRPQLRPPETFAQIADQKERSLALFDEAANVITHPRCLNCHPAGDRP